VIKPPTCPGNRDRYTRAWLASKSPGLPLEAEELLAFNPDFGTLEEWEADRTASGQRAYGDRSWPTLKSNAFANCLRVSICGLTRPRSIREMTA